jgi:excisionase family DNA binding protein
MTLFTTSTGFVTVGEACRILGCTRRTYARLAEAGRVPPRDGRRIPRIPRRDIERLATQMYPWASHAHDDQSYWVTSEMAATIMNVDRGQVELALAGERAPHLIHQDGTKMYRRHQVTEIAEHRAKRWGVPTTN